MIRDSSRKTSHAVLIPLDDARIARHFPVVGKGGIAYDNAYEKKQEMRPSRRTDHTERETMSIVHCPCCDAVLDDLALLTNVCSACQAVLGEVNQTMQTIRIPQPTPPITESDLITIARPSATCPPGSDLWDPFASDLEEEKKNGKSSLPRVCANPRKFSGELHEMPDFTLKSKLGEGGMGKVLTAVQQSIGREVAVKVLHADRIDTDNANKFQAEAAVTGNLEHPNIIPVYDLGLTAEGEPFYAMKKVKGKPWNDLIEGYSLQENIETLLKVCDAVAYAHSMGVIHRDLKPENVMVGEFGEVLVMDWGLAAGVWEESKAPRVTYSDAIAGTPAYMAPEMAKGDENQIGFASDIYLLGAILYEIITGRPPHGGKTVRECLNIAARNEIEEPWVQSELLKTARRAMATEPYDRYDNVREFQSAIRAHYRSVEAATRGRKHLTKARESGSYNEYFRAVAGFNEAIEIWEGNEGAATELDNAVRAFTEAALENGDRTLALALLSEARTDFPDLRARLS